jgi:hypothetical protein
LDGNSRESCYSAVPYALKAADAETLGGKPASAFLLAPSQAETKVSNQASSTQTGNSAPNSRVPSAAQVSGGGTTNFVPLWKTSKSLGNSGLFQTTRESIGLGTTSPGAKFDVLTSVFPIALRSTDLVPGGVALYGLSKATSGNGAGLVAATDSSQGIAGVFNNNAGGQILSLRNQGVEVFSLAGAGQNFGALANLNGSMFVNTATGFIGIGNPSSCSCGLEVNVGPSDGIRATAEGVGITAGSETAGVVAFAASTFAADAIDAQGSPLGGFAGNFNGNVNINGQLTKSSGSFKIDHPLDPANKYLYHSFVESADMMNIYNGNVILDGKGEAQVELPN